MAEFARFAKDARLYNGSKFQPTVPRSIHIGRANMDTTIEEKLRKKGFTNDFESGVIYGNKIQGIRVDVIPTAEEILGFANKVV